MNYKMMMIYNKIIKQNQKKNYNSEYIYKWSLQEIPLKGDAILNNILNRFYQQKQIKLKKVLFIIIFSNKFMKDLNICINKILFIGI